MHPACILAIVTAAGGPGPDSGLHVLDAERRIYAWSYGYDWEFNNGLDDESATTATRGRFDAVVEADLDDWWGFPVAIGGGTLASDIGCDTVGFTLSVSGVVEDAEVTQADGGSEGRVEIRFALDRPGRIVLDAQLDGEAGYVVGGIVLQHDTPGPALAHSYLQGPGQQDLQYDAVLPAGVYRLSADLQAWAWGGANADDFAAGAMTVAMGHHRLADLDLDGVVGPADVDAVTAAWGVCDECAEDLDGDGTVGPGDLAVLFGSWGSCADAKASILQLQPATDAATTTTQ